MAQPKHDVSRRNFIKTGAVAASAASLLGATAPARAAGANERLRIGFIGPGGRGMSGHVQPLARLRADGLPIELVAVNDVYTKNADAAFNTIKKALS